MSVPSALTAILTLGPAYGLQLHAELGARLPHRKATNVGQIYSTLDRLVRDGEVSRAAETEDGLPLYALTHQGIDTANIWLAGHHLTQTSPWSEILDVLLAGASIPASRVETACTVLEALFGAEEFIETDLNARADLNTLAVEHFSQAVLLTVKDVRQRIATNTLPTRNYGQNRPLRGRRPRGIEG